MSEILSDYIELNSIDILCLMNYPYLKEMKWEKSCWEKSALCPTYGVWPLAGGQYLLVGVRCKIFKSCNMFPHMSRYCMCLLPGFLLIFHYIYYLFLKIIYIYIILFPLSVKGVFFKKLGNFYYKDSWYMHVLKTYSVFRYLYIKVIWRCKTSWYVKT